MRSVNTLVALVGAAAMVEARPHDGGPPSKYTLTISAPFAPQLNGQKLQLKGNLENGAKVSAYCPDGVTCPKGKQTAFSGGLSPSSEVPGGQDCYIAHDGEILVTTQHSQTIPSDAYPITQGWKYTALKPHENAGLRACPDADDVSMYNCKRPTGFWTFQLPGTDGGLFACPTKLGNNVNTQIYAIYAKTPAFNKKGCTHLKGLATHEYKGVFPPVWAYY